MEARREIPDQEGPQEEGGGTRGQEKVEGEIAEEPLLGEAGGAPAPEIPIAPRAPAGAWRALLAGLQGGMVGALLMLGWLGTSAAWQQRSFWTSPNLMASAFYGKHSIHSGFASRTLTGVALYLTIYPLLGALVAVVLRDRLSRVRTTLLCMMCALLWYYASFRWMWEHVMPLVALLHAERPTMIGHLIYGLWLARYPEYLKRVG
jgi:hypothetical protein